MNSKVELELELVDELLNAQADAKRRKQFQSLVDPEIESILQLMWGTNTPVSAPRVSYDKFAPRLSGRFQDFHS